MGRTVAVEPIRGDWKISEVLRRHPELLEVLVGVNPAFRQLRNPVLRRVQSRLVSVEQAGEIAGLAPGTLVAALNRAIGVEVGAPVPADTGAARRSDAPAWVASAPVDAEVDAGNLQEAGEEPFAAIMAAARRVAAGHALRLWNPFEPTPLYEVLGARGFEHWARQPASDQWEILFLNTGRRRERPAADQRPAAAAADWSAPDALLRIDVSELVPPEPMVRILEALAELPAGSRLMVEHVRRPIHLYPRLEALGYGHETRERADGRVEILISKPADEAEHVDR